MEVFKAQYEIVQTEVNGEFSQEASPRWFLGLQHTTLNHQGRKELHPVMLLSRETAHALVAVLQDALTAMESHPQKPLGSALQ